MLRHKADPRAVIHAAALAAALTVACPAAGQTLSGRAAAIDGDDLLLVTAEGPRRVRLCGIDAPDRHAGRAAAKAALGELVAGVEVRCLTVGGGTPCDGRSKARVGRGGAQRVVAQCWVGGADIAAELVRQGHACDWPRYSGGWYGRLVAGGRGC